MIDKDIYGANTSILKGKTTRKAENHVREDVILDVPQYILDRYSKNVTLVCADVMHVNGLPFFIAISKHIKHLSLVQSKTFNKATMLSYIGKIVQVYKHRGISVTSIMMDNIFQRLEEELWERNKHPNIASADEHEEPVAEQCI